MKIRVQDILECHPLAGASCYDCLQETCLYVGWEMENELQPLFILGEVLLVLFFVEVWCNVFEGS